MGLYVWLKIKHGAGEYAAFWRMLATAVCTALLIGYLTVLSTQLVDEGGELPLLDTEQTYDCTDLGLRIRIPAGYSALEESIEPETDSTYARYTMYVLDGEWEFNIDALQDVFDPEAKSIADLSGYCASRDSAYYDGGIIKASRPLVSNGIDMLYSEGRRTEYPGFVFTAYDLKQGQSLITVGISYPSKEYGRTGTLRRVEELPGHRADAAGGAGRDDRNGGIRTIRTTEKGGLRAASFYPKSVGAKAGSEGAAGWRLTTSIPRPRARRTV